MPADRLRRSPRLELFLGRRLVHGGYAALLSIGAALGVAGVLVVLALFNNYYQGVMGVLVGVHPHLAITSTAAISPESWAQIISTLAAERPLVVSVGKALNVQVRLKVSAARRLRVPCFAGTRQACADPGLLPPPDVPYRAAWVEGASRSGIVELRGISVVGDSTPSDIYRLTASAQPLSRLNRDDPPACIIENTLVPGVTPGDDLLLGGPGVEELPVRVMGTMGLGLGASDVPLLVTSLALAQRIGLRGDDFNAVEVRLRDAESADQVARRLAAHLRGALRVTSWSEQSGGAGALLGVLRVVVFLATFSVVVVAALTVVSTLSLVVAESRPKIAVLRSMGLRDLAIYRLFVLRSLGIAAAGLVGGFAGGLLLTRLLLQQAGLREALLRMGVSHPEVLLSSSDLLALALGSLLTFGVTALVPARAACRVDVVRGLQA